MIILSFHFHCFLIIIILLSFSLYCHQYESMLPWLLAPWSSQCYSLWPRAACWHPCSEPCCSLTSTLRPSLSLRLKDQSQSPGWWFKYYAICSQQEHGLLGKLIMEILLRLEYIDRDKRTGRFLGPHSGGPAWFFFCSWQHNHQW